MHGRQVQLPATEGVLGELGHLWKPASLGSETFTRHLATRGRT
jgi:hypothetical protein